MCVCVCVHPHLRLDGSGVSFLSGDSAISVPVRFSQLSNDTSASRQRCISFMTTFVISSTKGERLALKPLRAHLAQLGHPLVAKQRSGDDGLDFMVKAGVLRQSLCEVAHHGLGVGGNVLPHLSSEFSERLGVSLQVHIRADPQTALRCSGVQRQGRKCSESTPFQNRRRLLLEL